MSDSLTALPGLMQSLVEAVARLEPPQGSDAELEARIREIELGLEKWAAKMEGEFLRAEAQYKAARSAEERSRTLERNAARLVAGIEAGEDGDEDVDPEQLRAWQDQFQGGHAGGGEAEGVPAVPSRVESRRETRARLRASKFAR